MHQTETLQQHVETKPEVETEVAAVVAPAADAPAPAAAAPDDAAAPAPAADAADPKQEELTEKDLLGSATLVTFPDRALGVSIEPTRKDRCTCVGQDLLRGARRVRAGDVVALVDMSPCRKRETRRAGRPSSRASRRARRPLKVSPSVAPPKTRGDGDGRAQDAA